MKKHLISAEMFKKLQEGLGIDKMTILEEILQK